MGSRHSSLTSERRASATGATAAAAKSKSGAPANGRQSPPAVGDKLLSSLDRRVLAYVRNRYPGLKQAAAGEMGVALNSRRPTTCSTTGGAGHSGSSSSSSSAASAAAGIQTNNFDGDVFIYPPNLKSANECSRCERDNRICDCIELTEPSSAGREVSEVTPREKREATPDGETKMMPPSGRAATTNEEISSDRTMVNGKGGEREEEEDQGEINMGGVYKISIATAVLDQQSNRLELLAPRLITAACQSAVRLAAAPTSAAAGQHQRRWRAKSIPAHRKAEGAVEQAAGCAQAEPEMLASTSAPEVMAGERAAGAEPTKQASAAIAIGTPSLSHETLLAAAASPQVTVSAAGDQLVDTNQMVATCKLRVGDAIAVSPTPAPGGQRRLRAAHKLSRQAILDEETSDEEAPDAARAAPLDNSSVLHVQPDTKEKRQPQQQEQQLQQQEQQQQQSGEPETHQLAHRSIFDGASKDEILEYLEDARERVPELLIAADEVMVIGDNELILVNQLEPNSPATPISIIDQTPRAGLKQAGAATQRAADETPTSLASGRESQGGLEARHSDETATRRSSQCGAAAAAVAAGGEPELERATALGAFLRQGNSLKALDSLAMSSVASLEGQSLASMSSLSAMELLMLNCCAGGGSARRHSPSELFRVTSPSEVGGAIGTSGSNLLEISEQVASMLRQDTGSPTRRSSNPDCPASGESSHAIRMLLLQKRHSTATQSDSFSSSSSSSSSGSSSGSSNGSSSGSSSSSPASAGSPWGLSCASSGLSQPTSGNCSASSNFYAALSLSCSSPLLAAGAALSQTGAEGEQRADSAPSAQRSLDTPPLVGATRLSVIDEQAAPVATVAPSHAQQQQENKPVSQDSAATQQPPKQSGSLSANRGAKPAALMAGARPALHANNHATINRLNNFLIQRHKLASASYEQAAAAAPSNPSAMVEFQCLDCDQFFITEQARVFHKANELRLLRETEIESLSQLALLSADAGAAPGPGSGPGSGLSNWGEGAEQQEQRRQQQQQLIDRAYVRALNGLPLCAACEKRRLERKQIILEFVDTELKYGRDLKIIHDEFYRPMQIAGLLSQNQINAIFLNLDELIMAHCRFAERLEQALADAHSLADTHLNSVHIGRLFVESADMLHTFESYCVRQGSGACQLARLAKEKELLRIFLRVSQMENALLRRMNLAAFLMVPVQRVTKYPLLLNRLYKLTAYHQKDREALRDAQLKVELHLEHINQQTKGVSATNKIWRRISSLSAATGGSSAGVAGASATAGGAGAGASCGNSAINGGAGLASGAARRGLISAEDISYIRLRKSAMELLKWDRDDTQFIHSGPLNLAPLNEFVVRQKIKSIRYVAAHALLIVQGKPNWRYRPDLVKPNLDSRLLVATAGGTGIKEAALLLFREKNGRFLACREPIYLSNCVLSNDCSLFNSEPPHHNQSAAPATAQQQQPQQQPPSACPPAPKVQADTRAPPTGLAELRAASADQTQLFSPSPSTSSTSSSSFSSASCSSFSAGAAKQHGKQHTKSLCSRTSDASEPAAAAGAELLAAGEKRDSKRSYSLASALPRAPIGTSASSGQDPGAGQQQQASAPAPTILNQLMTKVNSYHLQGHAAGKQPTSTATGVTRSASNVAPPSSVAAAAGANASKLAGEQQQQKRALKLQVLTRSSGQPAPLAQCDKLISSSTSDLRSAASSRQPGSQPGGQRPQPQPQPQPQAQQQHFNHHYFHNHHVVAYGDYEESFELHERLTKESLLLRADTPLKTRYWLQLLRYHAKDLGQWRSRRNGLANIMMMRQD